MNIVHTLHKILFSRKMKKQNSYFDMARAIQLEYMGCAFSGVYKILWETVLSRIFFGK